MAGRGRLFFSDVQKDSIREAVAAAEKLTSGEIAIMLVEESDLYREAEITGAVLVSGVLAAAIAVPTHHVTIWSYIPMMCLLFFPLRYLFRRFPRLKLPFAGPRRQAEAVRQRAVAAFHEKGLHRTAEETGILIFISLLEHKVWILGDRGINAKIAPESWQVLANQLAAGVREGRATEALCEVIKSCGNELAQHFPRRAGDRNELSDELIIS
ncbi:TPM domain-containing protein [Geomonas sp. RF6]|uniref:TPM domain-containing protein n=1 Tax=Geomonas sp. RF6 TaxID=2897342 RepID=UPI001E2A252B|nr:TPM domain-containing protein [Geomonas sp. RF6]UFS70525.1 TPM domain-containing protein [Geomonas sp. RF6]